MNIESKSNGNKAVVIGGSMAGLLAARVLSDHFKHVVVLERDDLSCDGAHRRGVPHGRHAHALLAGGQQALERLFPGICDELVGDGAIPADPLNDGTWFFEGAALFRTPTGTTGVMASRPFLEAAVRRRVRSIAGVEILDSRSVYYVTASENRERITGVVTNAGTIEADLVVDATGRGSQSANWLEALGYKPALQETVKVQLAYTTRLFNLRPDRRPNGKFVVIAPTTDGKRGGVMSMQEGGPWIVTLFGHFGQAAPGDLEGFVEYAKSLPSPLIYEAVRDAEPIGNERTFRFPASKRRRYEKLDRFPEGFLVFGDAICSFNPIYGQGMSVAALQAQALSETLRNPSRGIARRFFKKAAAVIDNPWNIAVGGDLKMPETVGPRGIGVTAINWYIGNVHKHAHKCPKASLAFNRVAQLLESPATLMRPGIAFSVLASYVLRKMRLSEGTREILLTTTEPQRRLRSDGF